MRLGHGTADGTQDAVGTVHSGEPHQSQICSDAGASRVSLRGINAGRADVDDVLQVVLLVYIHVASDSLVALGLI